MRRRRKLKEGVVAVAPTSETLKSSINVSTLLDLKTQTPPTKSFSAKSASTALDRQSEYVAIVEKEVLPLDGLIAEEEVVVVLEKKESGSVSIPSKSSSDLSSSPSRTGGGSDMKKRK
jgi:hypothetical protein